jgi:hypothetical protein
LLSAGKAIFMDFSPGREAILDDANLGFPIPTGNLGASPVHGLLPPAIQPWGRKQRTSLRGNPNLRRANREIGGLHLSGEG